MKGQIYFHALNNIILEFCISFVKNIIVTPAGFEPATNRAEIYHSIQLNYGAQMNTQKY